MFKKKKIYQITWAYDNYKGKTDFTYHDIIKAKDVAQAYKKHRKNRALPTYIVEIKVLEELENASK